MLSKAELKRVISAVPEPEDDNVGKWVVAVALAIEAEARAQDTALIRQLAEAIKMDRIDWEDWPDDSRTAFEKIRARLLDSDLSKLTARGAKAWTGIDAQDLRNGGKP